MWMSSFQWKLGGEERGDKTRNWNECGGRKKGNGRDKLRMGGRMAKMKRLGYWITGVGENEEGDRR